MDESVRVRFEVFGDECLLDWNRIGTGGFGHIYRAKNTTLGMDVAIKLLHYKDGRSASSIQKEAHLMLRGGNPHVIRILGLYEGPAWGSGLVMELMPKGSVADLLQTLAGPAPWPLTFRMAHEISLGMNYLHHLSLLHLDLKPSNVLLDNSLQAKLTDFGLSRVARSVSKSSRNSEEDDGGTLSYMPPEALQSVNYKASTATDVYSYGVLLWSLVTGKEPYAGVQTSLVLFRIPQGDRPDLTTIECPSRVKGLDDTVTLMTECWDQDPSIRPSFLDCVYKTKNVFLMHRHGVNDAVYTVQKQLDKDICSSLKSMQISHKPQNETQPPVSSCVTGPLPKQETASSHTASKKKDPAPPGMHIRTPQRQISSPGGGHISMSNVYGIQIGNNNVMNITHKTRQRHQTAPSRVSTSSSSSQNFQKKPQ